MARSIEKKKTIMKQTNLEIRTKDWSEKAREIYNLKVQIKELERKEKALFEEFKKISEFKPSTADGFKLNLIKRPGVVNYSVIPQLHGVDLEPYRKNPTEYWKLTFEGTV